MTAIPLVVAVLLFAMACYFLIPRKQTRAHGLRTAMGVIALIALGFILWLALGAK